MNGLSWRMAAAISGLHPAAVPRDALRAAESSLLDAVGVSLAASGLGEGVAAFADLVIAEGGAEESTVLGFGVRRPAAAAAFANGAMAHALDFEDSIDGVPVHPNAQVIPAALALAEQRDLSGERLLTAIAIGCDLVCRLGTVAGTALAERGWYPPPIVGALGATMACANLIGLDTRQTVDALSLAVSQAAASGEIKHSPLSLVRGIRDAFAAQVAVRSVQLAERGVRGFEAPLEGRAGFFAAFAGGNVDPAPLLDGLGSTFAGIRTSYKPWPSCRGTHAFVEAALELRREADPAGIDSIELRGSPVNVMLAEPVEAKRAPKTAIDAKFSLPFTVATALATGGVTLESFAPDSLRRRDVLELARLVEYLPDPALADDADMTVGHTVIRLKDGRVLSHEVLSPRGSPSSPMSTAELRAKFADCAAHAAHPLGEVVAGEVAERLLNVHAVRGLRKELGSLFLNE